MASYSEESHELDELDEPILDEDALEDWQEADLLRETALDEDEEISGDY
ncbi:MAG: hypothetical protein ACXVZO_07215 [Gaiellaceae bacterium]